MANYVGVWLTFFQDQKNAAGTSCGSLESQLCSVGDWLEISAVRIAETVSCPKQERERERETGSGENVVSPGNQQSVY